MTARKSPTRRRLVSAVVSLVLFAGAIYVLRSELRDHPFHEGSWLKTEKWRCTSSSVTSPVQRVRIRCLAWSIW